MSLLTCKSFIKTDSAIFFDRTIPQTCRDIHSLSIDLLKIPGWIIRKKYIADRLQISLRTVNRYFNLLVKRGLAFYDTVKHRWHVLKSAKPSISVACCEGGLPLVVEGGLPDLVANNQIEVYSEEKEQQPVVVFEEKENLVFPAQLTVSQKKEAKVRIKKVPMDMQQVLLTYLAACLVKGDVKNPIAYLNGLITRSNNGTFEAPQAPKQHKSNIFTGHKELPKVDNEQWRLDMVKKYGAKAAAAIAI